MKNAITKTTLGIVAISVAAFAATNALAGHDPYEQRAHTGPAWGHVGPAPVPPHVLFESRRLTQIIDARQARQHDRIMAGMQNRLLSRSEFRRLMHEQNAIRAMERDFLADGLMTQAEFQRLDGALDHAGHQIRLAMRERPAHYAFGNPWRD